MDIFQSRWWTNQDFHVIHVISALGVQKAHELRGFRNDECFSRGFITLSKNLVRRYLDRRYSEILGIFHQQFQGRRGRLDLQAYPPKFNIDTKKWWVFKRYLLSNMAILDIHVSFFGGCTGFEWTCVSNWRPSYSRKERSEKQLSKLRQAVTEIQFGESQGEFFKNKKMCAWKTWMFPKIVVPPNHLF